MGDTPNKATGYSLTVKDGKFYLTDLATGAEEPIDFVKAGNYLSSNFGSLKNQDGTPVSSGGYAKLIFALAQLIQKQPENGTVRDQLRSGLGLNYCLIDAVGKSDAKLAGAIWTQDERVAASVLCVFGEPEKRQDFLNQISVNPVSGELPKDVQTLNNGRNGVNGNGDGADATGTSSTPGGAAGGDSHGEGSTSPPKTTGGDPVILFSGAFVHQVTDMLAAGRGLHVEFRRTYISQMRYQGPVGYNWDHNYNLFLREVQEFQPDGSLRNVVYRSTGALREDPYVQMFDVPTEDLLPLSGHADAVFEGPAGYFDRLEKNGGRYFLESPNGLRVEYGEQLQAERIVDTNGNAITFHYDGLLLTEVNDPVGKRFTLHYDENNRVAAFRDETGGREVRYSYTSNGDLEEADLLFGDMTIGHDYRYSGADRPVIQQHNLIAIIGPTGETVLETEYAEDLGSPDFNRVIYQRSEDGEYHYEYDGAEDQDLDPAVDPTNVGIARTSVRYPNGHVIEHTFNAQGNTLRRVERVVGAAGTAETLVGQYRYNADGLLVEQVRPDGLRIAWRFGREAYADLHGGEVSGADARTRQTFGNLLRTVIAPRPGLGETRRIVFDLAYSNGNLLAMHRGPYYADVQLNPLPNQQILTTYFDHDSRGNLTATRFSGAFDAGGNPRAMAPALVTYGNHGLVTETSHGPLRVQFSYFEDAPRSGAVREQVEDPDGLRRTTAFEVDSLCRITRTTSPTGAMVDTEWTLFDMASHILEPEFAPGVRAQTQVVYNKHRKPAKVERSIFLETGAPHPETSHVVSLVYDQYGRRISVQAGSAAAPTQRMATTVHSPEGLPIRSIDPRGSETRYQYDERLLLSAVTTAFGTAEQSTVKVRYGRAREVVQNIDARGNQTAFSHDGFGRMVRVQTPEGTVGEFEYNATGQVVRKTVSGKHPETGVMLRWSETETEYDAAGLAIVVREHEFLPESAAGVPEDTIHETRFFYDSLGRQTRVADARGGMAKFSYDVLGRLTSAAYPGGVELQTAYDDTARTVTVTSLRSGKDSNGTMDTLSCQTVSQFAPNGTLTHVRNGSGNVTHHRYDSRNLLCATVRPDGAVHSVHYDIFGRPVVNSALVDGRLALTACQFDAAGNIVRIQTPSGCVVEQQFDAQNRLTSYQMSGSPPALMKYDRCGNVLEHLDENGVLAQQTFSKDNFLLSKSYFQTGFHTVPSLPQYRPEPLPALQYTYLPSGAVRTIQQGDMRCSYVRDSLGRVISEECRGHEVTYQYDSSGMCGMVYPDGRALRYVNSEAGSVESIRQIAVGPAYPGDSSLPVERDLVTVRTLGGLPFEIQSGQSHVLRLDYDSDFRVAAKRWNRLSDRQELMEERLERGSRGEVSKHSVGDRRREFDYDSLRRLVAFRDSTVPALAVDYSLDANANRLQSSRRVDGEAPRTTMYQPGTQDQIESIDDVAQIYDSAGNLLSDGIHCFAYDSAGRLARVTSASGSVEFVRDPAGRLAFVRDHAGQHEVISAGLGPIEWRTQGNVVRQFVPFTGPNQLAHVAAAGQEFVPITDVMDSVVAWVTPSGELAARAEYDPFGNILNRNGAWPAPFGYGGFLEDSVSPLCHLFARAYDPRHGRFLQRDPLGFAAGPNLYLFAGHAPVTLTDYFGYKISELDVSDVAKKTGWGLLGLGVGVAVTGWLGSFATTALIAGAMFASPLLAVTGLVVGGLTAIALGGLVIYGVASSYSKARDGGYGPFASAGLSVPSAFLPIMQAKEAWAGREFGTGRVLSQDERDAAAGSTITGVAAAIFAGNAWLNRRTPAQAPTTVMLADLSDDAISEVMQNLGREFPEFGPVRQITPGGAARAETLGLSAHGSNPSRYAAGADGFTLSPETAGRFGLAANSVSQNDQGQMVDVFWVRGATAAATFIVESLGFRGGVLDLRFMCGSGRAIAADSPSFALEVAQEVAQLLGKQIVVRGGRGYMYFDPASGRFEAAPWVGEDLSPYVAPPLDRSVRFSEDIVPEP